MDSQSSDVPAPESANLTSISPQRPKQSGRATIPADVVAILGLRGRGETVDSIAEKLGIARSTVGDICKRWADSRPLAKEFLQSRSYKIARRLVRSGTPQTDVKVLQGLGVLQPDTTAQIAVVLGSPTGPSTLSAPTFDVE